jgi:hypothetical protein
MKVAIVTLAIGEWEDIPEIHKPMRALADACGADFIKITGREHPDWHIFYEKVQIQKVLRGGYDYVLYLDGDVLVTPHGIAQRALPVSSIPSLFDERSRSDYLTRSVVEDQYAIVGKTIPDLWDGRHYNAGVMSIPKDSVSLLDDPIVTSVDYQDQAWLNWKIAENLVEVAPMDWWFNCMPFASKGVKPEAANFVHYAGWGNYVPNLKDFRGLVRAFPYIPHQFRAARPKETMPPIPISGGPIPFICPAALAASGKKSPPPGVRGTEQGAGRGGRGATSARRSRSR